MNALLTSLVNDVYTLTNRPDLVGETLLAVKRATLKAHHLDYFYKDLVEDTIVFGTSEYFQTLDYRLNLTRWRAQKYFRKYDETSGTPGKFLTLLTPEEVLDNYFLSKEDIYYAAGDNLQIRSSTQEDYFLIGYYSNPDLVEASYTSWIALDNPYCIIFDATASIFKTIGYDQQNAVYQNMVSEELTALRNSNIIASGE